MTESNRWHGARKRRKRFDHTPPTSMPGLSALGFLPFVLLVLPLQLGRIHACVWSITSDFRASPRQENPNRDSCDNSQVWWFTDGGPPPAPTIPLFNASFNGNAGIQLWHGSTGGMTNFVPWFGQNTNPTRVTFGTASVPSLGIIMHPSPRDVVLSWRCPATGTYAINGGVTHLDGCGDGINWSLAVAGVEVRNGILPFNTSALFNPGIPLLDALPISLGQFVSVSIGNGGSFGCDPTGVDLTITTSTLTTTASALTLATSLTSSTVIASAHSATASLSAASTSAVASTASTSTSASITEIATLAAAATTSDVLASTSLSAVTSTASLAAVIITASLTSFVSTTSQTTATFAIVSSASSTLFASSTSPARTSNPNDTDIVVKGTVTMQTDWTPPSVVIFVGNSSSVVVNGVATLGGATAVIQSLPTETNDDNVVTTRRTLVIASGGIVGKFGSVEVSGTSKDKHGHCYRYDAMSQETQGNSLTVLVVARPEVCRSSSPSAWIYVGVAAGIIGLMILFAVVMWCARDQLLKPDFSELVDEDV